MTAHVTRQPLGPKRSTRTSDDGQPSSTSRLLANSAKPAEPQTNVVATGDDQRAELGGRQPARRTVRLVGSGQRDPGAGRGELVGVGQVLQGAGGHGQLQQVGPAEPPRRAAASPPAAPPRCRRRRRPPATLASQTNQPPIGPRTWRSSPTSTTSARNPDTSPSSSRSIQQLDQGVRRARRRSSTSVAPRTRRRRSTG